ncbi:MAG: PaaI family thioesterase [Clostridiales bacterium]|nr:PaaI family thioesterase [Candidatus Cacconaster stercorequi]
MTEERRQNIKNFINNEAFVSYNHIRVTDVDDGMAVVECELQQESMNRWDSPHGGLLFSIGDMAAGTATLSQRLESCMTMNASINYIATVGQAKKLIATGRVTKSGGKVSFCDVEICDETGRLAARLSAVMYCTGKKLDL